MEQYYELLQSGIDDISHIWVESEGVSEVFAKRDLERVYFEIEIGRGVLSYFIRILKDPRLLGDCPVMRTAIQYFQENEIRLDDVYMICNELKFAIKRFLYENSILNLDSYVGIEREIDIILSKNLKSILAYFATELVSEKKEVVKELEEVTVSRNELKNIIEALNNSAIVQIISMDGTILDTNEKAIEITGFPRDEMVGKNLKSFRS